MKACGPAGGDGPHSSSGGFGIVGGGLISSRLMTGGKGRVPESARSAQIPWFCQGGEIGAKGPASSSFAVVAVRDLSAR